MTCLGYQCLCNSKLLLMSSCIRSTDIWIKGLHIALAVYHFLPSLISSFVNCILVFLVWCFIVNHWHLQYFVLNVLCQTSSFLCEQICDILQLVALITRYCWTTNTLKWHPVCLWISYHKSPVLGFKRSHKQPLPCPLHGCLI